MPNKQTDSFKELGAFLVHKTGTGQAWNKRYQSVLNRYIEKYGVDVLIGACLRADFNKVEYAIEIWGGLDNRTEDQEWWIPAARERYHAMRQRYLQGKMDSSRINRLVRRLGITTTRRKAKWSAPDELKKIQDRHGPRSPEAREFERKWCLSGKE